MRVLIIEDKAERIGLLSSIYFQQEVFVADNIDAAINALNGDDYELIHLDYDLHDRNTEEIANLISENSVVVIHSENPDGVKVLQNKIPGSSAIPFHLLIEQSDYSSRLKSMMASNSVQNLKEFYEQWEKGSLVENP